jgi:hypothetical protein
MCSGFSWGKLLRGKTLGRTSRREGKKLNWIARKWDGRV